MIKRQKMTEEEITAAAVESLRHALGGPDSDVGQARLRNIEAYNAEAVGVFAPPEVEDRSDFVATDVADTVNGMLPQIMQIFVASDDVVEFEAKGQGTEGEAKLATAYVNHLFYVRNDGVSIVHDWFWDALVQKVGFVKVWVEEDATDAKQRYEGQSQEQLVMLLQDGWQLQGEPEADEYGGLSFIVTKEDRYKCVKVAVVAPGEMRVDGNARWDDEPAMIGQVFYKRRFQWEQDGFDVSDYAGTGASRFEEESQALLGEVSDFSVGAGHESHELIQGSEVYLKLDADGDGVAEWLKVCLVGDKLARLEDGSAAIEQVDDHPFVWICPNPRPHSFYGDCPADFAYQAQRLRTTTVRAIQDNMVMSVNGRMYVNTSADVNIDDVLDNRPNGVVRGRGPAGDAISPLVQPTMTGPAYQFNDYIGAWAENRTGFNRYSAGTDANALNKTKGGVEMLTAKADMRMGLTARHFAVGMRKLFAKMLKCAIQYQNQPEMVALQGQFYPINPGEFRSQLRTKINVGLGTGTKEQQSIRVMALADMMMRMGQPAGLVRPEHIAEVMRLFVEANEFKAPERFMDTQPQGMPPTPQAFNALKAQAEQQMSDMQAEIQRLEQENEQLKADKQAEFAGLTLKSREVEIKEAEFELRKAQAEHDARMDITDPNRQASERDNSAVSAMLAAADALIQVAQSQAQAQLSPRVVQVVGPSGQVYTGSSAPVVQ